MSTSELTRYCLGILPELILSVTICAVILLDMFSPLRRSRLVCGSAALLGILWALILVIYPAHAAHEGKTLFGAMLVRDGLGGFFKLVFLLGAAATVLFSMRS